MRVTWRARRSSQSILKEISPTVQEFEHSLAFFGLVFGRKAMKSLDRILISREITLLTKVHIVKAVFFPVVIYGYENWTIKKAEH